MVIPKKKSFQDPLSHRRGKKDDWEIGVYCFLTTAMRSRVRSHVHCCESSGLWCQGSTAEFLQQRTSNVEISFNTKTEKGCVCNLISCNVIRSREHSAPRGLQISRQPTNRSSQEELEDGCVCNLISCNVIRSRERNAPRALQI